MFKIKDVVIDPPFVLAPVAGHTDSVFRRAVKDLGGCGLVVSELASTEGMTRGQGRTDHITRFAEGERPVAIQIFGADPARMAESAAMVEAMGADIVDINCGCPVKKVVRQGGGSRLLRDLPLLERIFRAVRGAIRIPLTVKIRSGWDHDSINALEVLRLAEDCGVDALAIHGRTRSDFFSGKADWGVIAEVKTRARIPVMGNGDVFTPEDAARMLRETGVDGVMMGRGVLSNPWLIRQCRDYMASGKAGTVSLRERMEFMSAFLGRVCAEVPPPVALGKIKKVGGYLSKGLPGGSRLRGEMHAARTTAEFFEALEGHFAALEGAGGLDQPFAPATPAEQGGHPDADEVEDDHRGRPPE
ncbi:MAG: tRNA dihydrouridine synthase DusB [Acidobacteria bacterium]|nr:tRNA dihydrouridine synthase DusB [Acidobacteriota bacterium]